MEYWLPLLLWLLTSYIFSTDAFSAGETSKIVGPILKFVFTGISDDSVDFWHMVIRKAAHVTEYFVLGVLAYRVFHYGEPSSARAKATTILFVVVAAMTDETHQLFTASRTGSIVDVGYDSAGALLAAWGLSRRRK